MAYRHILNKITVPLFFVLIGASARLLPHPPNFTPIAAMALFGGVYMSKKQALILPLLAMVVSDFFIGFDSIPIRLAVYGSFLLTVFIGLGLKKRTGFKNILAASILSSVIFFLITNFAVWAFGTLYPHTVSGLTDAYFYAIPFFRNTAMGDLFYNGAFFGAYALILNISPRAVLEQKA